MEVSDVGGETMESADRAKALASNLLLVGLVLLSLFLSACGTVPQRNPLPQIEGDIAPIPGLPVDARFWGDQVPEFLLKRLRTSSKEEIQQHLPAWVGGKHHYIAISGGGQNGAFGAGLMNGWTAAGDRPEFLLVTGVSTGALSAPFVFLGPDYDDELASVYTTLETSDLLETRYWTAIVTGDAAVDTDKLRDVIGSYIDDEMIRRLAEEHLRGRRLYIGTTNLDAKRPVIWSLTHIAASDYPKKKKLIGDVLLASASIPGAFPPVLINIEWDGQRYDELHVDGGTVSQVFVYPTALDFSAVLKKLDVTESHEVYVIRNSKLAPEWEPVEPSIFNLAGTSISSLIRTQGLGDLSQIYLLTQRDGGEYRLAYIPEDFEMKYHEPFDPTYMKALYDFGFEMGKQGYPWDKLPPAAKEIKIE
jgi:predicted acylesterase/phospholipase RssA